MKKLFLVLVMGVVAFTSLLHSVEYPPQTISEREIFAEGAIIFSGNGNRPLAEAVSEYFNIPLGDALVGKFNDGEIQIRVNDSVRNKNVYIIQSNCPSENQSVNDNIMELFLLVRTMKRSSAASVIAVIPYYGYARQDRKTSERVPISAADIALLLEMAGVDRVITVDIHCGQIQGFFQEIPVDNLNAAALFIPYFVSKKLENVVVISPDAGGVERAKRFMENLIKEGVHADIGMISKQRAKAGVIASMNLIGEVRGADVIIVDDMCDTGGTLVKAAQLLKDKGAKRVFTAITHPVFSGDALDKIRDSAIDEMVISDTVPLRGKAPSNLRCISVGSLLGEAIRRIESGRSLADISQ